MILNLKNWRPSAFLTAVELQGESAVAQLWAQVMNFTQEPQHVLYARKEEECDEISSIYFPARAPPAPFNISMQLLSILFFNIRKAFVKTTAFFPQWLYHKFSYSLHCLPFLRGKRICTSGIFLADWKISSEKKARIFFFPWESERWSWLSTQTKALFMFLIPSKYSLHIFRMT